MALVGINPGRPRDRGPSTLERIAQGLDIAQKVLGVSLAVPTYLREKESSAANLEKTKAETALLGSKKKELEDESQPLSLEDQKYYVDLGVPMSLVPKTIGQAKETAKTFWESPAQKASREKTDLMAGLLASSEKRAQRQEGREAEKFSREMTKPVLTPAEETVDKNFAKNYEEWTAQGGYANASKNLNQARWAMKKLLDAQKEGKNYSGRDVGLTSDKAKALAFPDAAAIEDQVTQIVTSNLRAALGAQFTEKEGARIMRQTFNPMLDEKENARRLGNLINELEQAYAAKDSASKWYEKNGTLKGWTGKMKDFIKTEATPDPGAF